MHIDYEKLENFSFVHSEEEEEDNIEFSMINPDLLDLDLEVGDGVSNAPVVLVTIDNLLLPSQQFYELCSQLNEGQQHLFNFVMQHAVHCKLAEKNNELEPKPFQIFLSGGAGVGKSFLDTAITEHLRRVLRYPRQNLDNPSLSLLLHLLEKLLLMSMVLYYIMYLTSLLNQDCNCVAIRSQVMKHFIS